VQQRYTTKPVYHAKRGDVAYVWDFSGVETRKIGKNLFAKESV